jgi:DnaK suppressor protein
MQDVQRENLKLKLLALLSEMQQPLRRRDQIAVENAPDTLDSVQIAAERDLAIHQIESEFNRLNSVRLALARIKEGTYGTCIRCEGEIGQKRLQAVPWTSYCIRCQEAADSRETSLQASGGNGSDA